MTGDFAIAYDKSVLYGIHYFAHVARSWIRQEQILYFGRQHRGRATNLLGITLNEMPGKRQYVLLALAQWWKFYAKHGNKGLHFSDEVSAQILIAYKSFYRIAIKEMLISRILALLDLIENKKNQHIVKEIRGLLYNLLSIH